MKTSFLPWLAIPLIFVATPALAHDPGLSSLVACAHGRTLAVEWHLNPGDLEWLTAESDWRRPARRLIRFEASAVSVAPRRFTAETWATDGWKLRWDFALPEQYADASLTATALDRFRFGHRVHASTCDQGGVMIEASLLSEAHPSWDLAAVSGSADGSTLVNAGLVGSGIVHILTGWDHLLFLLLLLVAAVSLRQAVVLVTLFSLAHSVTLALGALGWLRLPAQPVEVAIAASIVLAAGLNLSRRGTRASYALTFGVGLIHGLGFAGFTSEILAAAPPSDRLGVLAQVNLGIEVGQLAIVLAVLPLIAYLRRVGLGRASALASSGLAAGVGSLWVIERILG